SRQLANRAGQHSRIAGQEFQLRRLWQLALTGAVKIADQRSQDRTWNRYIEEAGVVVEPVVARPVIETQIGLAGSEIEFAIIGCSEYAPTGYHAQDEIILSVPALRAATAGFARRALRIEHDGIGQCPHRKFILKRNVVIELNVDPLDGCIGIHERGNALSNRQVRGRQAPELHAVPLEATSSSLFMRLFAYEATADRGRCSPDVRRSPTNTSMTAPAAISGIAIDSPIR